jgi:hypothetical protein
LRRHYAFEFQFGFKFGETKEVRRKGWCEEEWELGEARREEMRMRNGEDHRMGEDGGKHWGVVALRKDKGGRRGEEGRESERFG